MGMPASQASACYGNVDDSPLNFLLSMQWDSIMQQANQSLQNLDNPENLKILASVLKTNVAACGSIGAGYFSQLGRIYLDLLGVYKAVSQLISESVVKQGP